ncbi:hypothetical protein SDC9_152862 [bioreactor metagenome]|uniref:Uncharacterized protein n=1 Tax=bioreactor metagenome TaxID=1076179 RepID=A0A645EUA7_9ZZZZ
MGDHRGHRVFAPMFGRRGLAVRVVLEPQHRGAQDAAFGEIAAHPGLDGAQIFADDECPGALSLQHDDADERIVVVAHIGALARRAALGDPPEPEHAEDVVDPHAARMAEGGLQHAAERAVSGIGEPVGPPRRLSPVLSELVIAVRRRADADVLGVDVAHHPGVGRGAAHSDREIGHDADRHARVLCSLLGVAELVPGDPLQPLVEGDLVKVVVVQFRHPR